MALFAFKSQNGMALGVFRADSDMEAYEALIQSHGYGGVADAAEGGMGMSTLTITEIPEVSGVSPDTLQGWLIHHGVMMKSEPGASEAMPEGFKSSNPYGYTCEFEYKGRRASFDFWQGQGHGDRCPDMNRVIECLLDESNGVMNCRDFEEWADCYGYDSDSRKAERTYNACVKNADKMIELFGADLSALIDLYLDGDY